VFVSSAVSFLTHDEGGPFVAEKLMTVQELAEYVGVPRSTVYQWNYAGTGPRFLKVGKYTRFRLADVDAWLAERCSEKAS
jgi:excisionase family DNA binding protein